MDTMHTNYFRFLLLQYLFHWFRMQIKILSTKHQTQLPCIYDKCNSLFFYFILSGYKSPTRVAHLIHLDLPASSTSKCDFPHNLSPDYTLLCRHATTERRSVGHSMLLYATSPLAQDPLLTQKMLLITYLGMLE